MGTIIFYPVTLTLVFDLFIKDFKLGDIFWVVCTIMSIPCEKTITRVQKKKIVTLTLVFDLLIGNF
jgi:hypothetical protein